MYHQSLVECGMLAGNYLCNEYVSMQLGLDKSADTKEGQTIQLPIE